MEIFIGLVTLMVLGGIAFLMGLLAISFRTVVSTNDVHIIQSGRKTVSYGKDQKAGNVYYKWPSWVPFLGIQVSKLPVSVFDIQLDGYSAYDKGRVPFLIDIMAFFRIEDSNIAAQRVKDFKELIDQLHGIIQGACRSILAKEEINEILEERSKYGMMFTDAVDHQLEAWGVKSVKNIELMDIRDVQNSKVIENIMAKKKSMIEMESRVAVANNMQKAQEAEIEAQRVVAVRKQEAEQLVGIRTAEKEQQVGIATQVASQKVKEQEALTAEKQMSVQRVNTVRQAEIDRDVQLVKAEQQQKTAVIVAEGEKQQTIKVAEGNLEQAKLAAQGVRAQGEAKGAAEQAVLMAPVNSQIALAKEIGENENYQKYLITIRTIEASQAVGVEQAHALTQADVKVISNTGAPAEGLENVMSLFSPKGGLQIGGMLEALNNTDVGAAVLNAVKGNGSKPNGAAHG